MAIFSWGNRPKPKPFGFIPRYYDEAKEELEARLAKYGDNADDAELLKTRIKSGLSRRSRSGGDSYRTASRKSNVRLLGIIGVLTLLTMLILRSDRILTIITALSEQ